MYILGISALYHDSAACIIHNGEIIAAAQEERFSRIKHDSEMPINAVDYCIREAGINKTDIEAIVYYDRPDLTLDRFLFNVLALGSESKDLIDSSYDAIFGKKIWVHKIIEHHWGLGKRGSLLTCKHHISHAASAFYPSPFERAVIITIDGVGEWTTTAIGVGNGNRIELKEELNYPHSLGLFYSAFTYFCGFKVNSGDYKFMGLAPYGKPVYYEIIKKEIIDIKPDGSFILNLEYFDYYNGKTMINEEKLSTLFGGKGRRLPETRITKREMNIAASVQKITEEIIILIAQHAKEKYGKDCDNLVMAGGVALNCVANGKLQNLQIFKNVWIQPAAGDAGGALGAALFAYYNVYGGERVVYQNDCQNGSFLGPAFSDSEIEAYLNQIGAKSIYFTSRTERNKMIANLLSEEKVIGLMQGRMEYGPRALGNRSIIADCRSQYMQSRINLKIKYRESFRPFAPIVLEEKKDDYFELVSDSPYMLKVGKVKDERINKEFDLEKMLDENDNDMLKVVSSNRSDIPAVTHVDYSARIQTVDKSRNPDLHSIMKEYESLTGFSVLVNTSFNVRGEPIVCTYKDAYECFMRTDMDVLVLEDFILYKENQPVFKDDLDWRDIYELD